MNRPGRRWQPLRGDSVEVQELAAALRAMADDSGMSLRSLEHTMPYSRSTISDYLSGHRRPDWVFIQNFVNSCFKQDPHARDLLLRRLRSLWEAADPVRATPLSQPATEDIPSAERIKADIKTLAAHQAEAADRIAELTARLEALKSADRGAAPPQLSPLSHMSILMAMVNTLTSELQKARAVSEIPAQQDPETGTAEQSTPGETPLAEVDPLASPLPSSRPRPKRLTMPTLVVLRLLLQDPFREWYGAEISNALGMPGGTIYPLLERLESFGWLESRREIIDPKAVGRPPRRYFRLTNMGVAEAKEALARSRSPRFPRFSPPSV